MKRGKLYYFSRFFVRLVLGDWIANIPPPDGPTIFVCCHDNILGPLSCLAYLPFPIRPWVLHVFCQPESCRKQFREYTFSKRFGIPSPLAGGLAWIASGYFSALVRSLGSIPVYRGSLQATATLKETVAALQEGDSVLIFPDVDYTNRDGGRELYAGFLLVDRLWRKVSSVPLRFVPLRIDRAKKQIRAGEAATFNPARDRKTESARVLAALQQQMEESKEKLREKSNRGEESREGNG